MLRLLWCQTVDGKIHFLIGSKTRLDQMRYVKNVSLLNLDTRKAKKRLLLILEHGLNRQ